MFLSIIMPCKNEKDSVGDCVKSAKEFLNKNDIDGEILVVDASDDNSAKLAEENGAKVITQTTRGYGEAIREGVYNANGDYIIVGNCDGTYDFSLIGCFVKCFNEDYDYINGDRLINGIEFNLSYFTAKFLSKISKHKGKTYINDVSSGFYGFSKELLDKLNITSNGKNFIPEFIYKVSESDALTCEIPVFSRTGSVKHKKGNILKHGYNMLRYILAT